MGNSLNMTRKGSARLIRIVYGMIALGVILFSMWSFLHGSAEWVTESYGTTTDGQLMIEDGSVYRVSFIIRHDGFRGINVKLSPAEVTYGEEQLLFTLTDQQTGDEIDRYEIALADMVCLVDTFIPLQYDRSAGREVSVTIAGENLHRSPALSLSENHVSDTTLYVNGKPEKNRYLVFSAAYRKDSRYNIQAAVRGIAILLFLALAYFWTGLEKREHKEVSAEKCRDSAKEEKRTRKVAAGMLLMFLLLSAVYVFLTLYTYINLKRNVLSKDKSIEVVSKDDLYSGEIRIDENTAQMTYTFLSQQKALSSLIFSVSASPGNGDARIHVRIWDRKYKVCCHDETVKVKDLPSKRGRWEIFLRNELSESRDREVTIELEPVAFDDAEVVFYTGRSGGGTEISIDGRRTNLFPILYACYAKNFYLKTLFLIFTVLGYGFLVLCFVLLSMWKISPEKGFLPLTLYLGLLYMLVVPVYSVPDEYTHIDSAYIVSNRLLGIEAPEGMPGYDYKRAEDVDNGEYLRYAAEKSDYRRLYTDLFRPATDTSLVLTACRDATANAGVLYYVPAAIGLTIGRLLSLGTLPMLMLGRFFNLVMSLLLCYYALRKLPGKRWLFLLYATTPILLQEAASFSYDALLNAFAMVYIALCFSYVRERVHSFIDPLMLFFAMFQIATVKGGVYFPICFVILVIPVERRWKLRRAALFTGVVSAAVMTAFMQNNISMLLRNYLTPKEASIAPFSGGDLFTVGYIREHLLRTVNVAVTTVFTETSRLIWEFFGGKMGSMYQIQMPWMYILLFIGVFVMVGRRDSEGSVIVRRLSVAGIVVITGMVMALIALSMLLADTTTSSSAISGLQGRYYIPVMFAPLAALFSRWNCEREDGPAVPVHVVTCYFLAQCVFLYNMILVIFS